VRPRNRPARPKSAIQALAGYLLSAKRQAGLPR
jgi:hypothetical protein